ncbi:MAG: class I SAM-dependent methyltransferase [Gammaproteobacteria bacterium]
MGLYDRYILPRLITVAMRDRPMARERQAVVPHARGVVLEVGIGSGENLPFYDATQVKHLHAIEPSPALLEQSREWASQLDSISTSVVQGVAENLPYDNNSMDSIVLTYTLCSLPLLQQSMDEMSRVLKPSGRIYFSEHGKAPQKRIARWQKRLTPLWSLIAGGCKLNLDIPHIITAAGYRIEHLDQHYLPGPRVLRFNHRGIAALRR